MLTPFASWGQMKQSIAPTTASWCGCLGSYKSSSYICLQCQKWYHSPASQSLPSAQLKAQDAHCHHIRLSMQPYQHTYNEKYTCVGQHWLDCWVKSNVCIVTLLWTTRQLSEGPSRRHDGVTMAPLVDQAVMAERCSHMLISIWQLLQCNMTWWQNIFSRCIGCRTRTCKLLAWLAFFDHMATGTSSVSFVTSLTDICLTDICLTDICLQVQISHHVSWQIEEKALHHMRNDQCAHRLSSPGTNCFLAKDPTPSAAITMSPWYFFSPFGVSAVTVTPDSLCCSRATLWLKLTAPCGKALMSSRCRSLQCILQKTMQRLFAVELMRCRHLLKCLL